MDARYMVSKVNGECLAIFMYKEDADSFAYDKGHQHCDHNGYEVTPIDVNDVHEYM